jgi:hypothetical protein
MSRPPPKCFWPASAITPAETALLFHARQATSPRVPISQLLARAVRQAYAGHAPQAAAGSHSGLPEPNRKEVRR